MKLDVAELGYLNLINKESGNKIMKKMGIFCKSYFNKRELTEFANNLLTDI